jgi:uncharacterized membrane protein
MNTKKLVMISMMAAIIFVITWTIKIPLPFSSSGGYINLGDAAIYFSGAMLGPLGGFFAAAVGSALADVLGGAMIYALPTFFIKGLMGLVCGYIMLKRQSFKAFVAAALIGGLIMVSGYFIFEYFMMDKVYAVAALPFNVVQWLGSSIMALPLFKILSKGWGKY